MQGVLAAATPAQAITMILRMAASTPVYLTEKAYNVLGPLFKELGVRIEPVKEPANTGIIIHVKGFVVEVTVTYEDGRVERRNFNLNAFKSALITLAKQKQNKRLDGEDGDVYYKIEVTDEILELLEAHGGGEGDE